MRFLALIVASFVASCAPMNPLVGRVSPPDDRRFHVIAFGNRLPPDQRVAYLEGRVIRGMRMEVVFDLLGEPDEQISEKPWITYEGVLDYRLKTTKWFWYRNGESLGCVMIMDSVVAGVSGFVKEGDGKNK